MKFPVSFPSLIALFLLVATPHIASAQFQITIVEQWYRAASIMLDNEIEPTKTAATNEFSWNPLILNGKSLDYTRFGIRAQGVMTVVKGNPELPNAEKIPFHIYLRRDGIIIHNQQSDNKREVFSIEISEVLKSAKPGDNLIIEPTRTTDQQAKRIIKLLNDDGC